MTDETKPAEAPTPAADAAAASAAVTTEAAATPQPTADETAAAAFKQGVAEASEDGEAPAAVETKPEKTAADTEATEPPPEKTDEQKRDEAIEKEIADAKMKPATADRFRELSKRKTDEEVEKIVAPLREKAEKADSWEKILVDSTARPDQLSNALGYLQAINSGDPGKMNAAYDMMSKELAWLGQQLGREVPGAYDPLSEHPDLKAQVESGDMPRPAALEIARHRATTARTLDFQSRRADSERTERERKEAFDRGIAELGALSNELRAGDPQYPQKFALLKPQLDWASANLHPSKWVSFVRNAYAQIKIAPAQTPPPVAAVPLRPTGSSAHQQAVPKNDVEAFKMGVASYRG